MDARTVKTKLNSIPKTRTEKLAAMKAFSNSDTRKKQMAEANEMLRLHPFSLTTTRKRPVIKSAGKTLGTYKISSSKISTTTTNKRVKIS